MKLTLTHERGLEYLTAEGSIEPRDVQVLKVGVGKLIRDGKNQIALEVAEATMPDELVRELMALDLVARELSGRVVVLATSSALRTKLENFARPMTLGVFSDRGAVEKFFESINDAPLGPIQGAAPSVPSVADLEGSSEVAPEEQVKLLKEEIRQRELQELGKLRETISRLENENRVLLDQFKTYFIERRQPPDERAYQQRIADLEARLEKFMDEQAKEKGK